MTPPRLAALGLLAFLLVMQLPLQKSRVSAAPSPRLSSTCVECHEGYDTSLEATMHQLPSADVDAPAARVACTDCHAGDARHYEEDPAAFRMANPESLTAAGAAQACARCHQNTHQQNMQERNVHFENNVTCSACHKIHGSTHASLLREPQTSLCFSCHSSQAVQFAKPYRHPLNDEVMACSECHQSLDETRRDLSLNGSNVCMSCHDEFAGPFPFEHQATVDYSTQEGACITCHDPHGSYQPRMLKQPYEPPHFQLCSQCHTVPKHNFNSNHGTMWAGVACNECHTDIHGSYLNRKFLSESLQTQGCINAGCHQF